MDHEAAVDEGSQQGCHRRGRRLWVFVRNSVTAKAFVALLVGLLAGAWSMLGFDHHELRPTTVKISSPLPNDVVESTTRVSGSVHNLPSDARLFVAVFDPGSLRENPARQACNVTQSTFICGEVYVGASQASGAPFRIEIWEVSAPQIADINDYTSAGPDHGLYPGLPQAPDGTAILATVNVTRA